MCGHRKSIREGGGGEFIEAGRRQEGGWRKGSDKVEKSITYPQERTRFCSVRRMGKDFLETGSGQGVKFRGTMIQG